MVSYKRNGTYQFIYSSRSDYTYLKACKLNYLFINIDSHSKKTNKYKKYSQIDESDR